MTTWTNIYRDRNGRRVRGEAKPSRTLSRRAAVLAKAEGLRLAYRLVTKTRPRSLQHTRTTS